MASTAAIAAALGGAAQAQSTIEQVEVRGAASAGLSLSSPTDGGSRLGLTPLETPASIEILSGDTIRARGDISLSDAIARSTGIVQQNNPGNGSTASFAARGFQRPRQLQQHPRHQALRVRPPPDRWWSPPCPTPTTSRHPG